MVEMNNFLLTAKTFFRISYDTIIFDKVEAFIFHTKTLKFSQKIKSDYTGQVYLQNVAVYEYWETETHWQNAEFDEHLALAPKNGFLQYHLTPSFLQKKSLRFLYETWCHLKTAMFYLRYIEKYDCSEAPMHCNCWYKWSTSERCFLF